MPSGSIEGWFDEARAFYAPYRDRLLTPAQRERLRAIGCQYGQGHLFSPALPADQFERTVGEVVSGTFAQGQTPINRPPVAADNGDEQ